MKNYGTITVEARPFVCPRKSCQHEWLCYRWKDYVQCPVCHATITLNPKRQPRASYNKKSALEGSSLNQEPNQDQTQNQQSNQANINPRIDEEEVEQI